MVPIKSRLSTWTDKAHFCVWPLTAEQPLFFSSRTLSHSIQAWSRLWRSHRTNQSLRRLHDRKWLLFQATAASHCPRHLATAIVQRYVTAAHHHRAQTPEAALYWYSQHTKLEQPLAISSMSLILSSWTCDETPAAPIVLMLASESADATKTSTTTSYLHGF